MDAGLRLMNCNGDKIVEVRVVGRGFHVGNVENIRFDQVGRTVIDLPPGRVGFQHKTQRRLRILLLDLLEDLGGPVQIAVHHQTQTAGGILAVV